MCRVLAPLISKKYYFKYENTPFLKHYNPEKLLVMPQPSQLAIVNYLPLSITSLKLIMYSPDNTYLPPEAFPNLTKLHLKSSVLRGPYPPKLKKLKIDGGRGPSKIDQFPSTLTHLWMNGWYLEEVKELPPNLTHLTSEYCCISSSVLLPKTLTHLHAGFYDKKWYQKVILPNLKKVSYLHNLQHQTILTTSLTCIIFTHNFDESIDALQHLPNLKTIFFGSHFNHLVNLLPLSVTHLHFGELFTFKFLLNLPANLHLLKLGLTSTTITIDFNQVCILMWCNCNLFFLQIPSLNSLLHLYLIFDVSYSYSIVSVPPNLTHLTFHSYISNVINNLEFERDSLYRYLVDTSNTKKVTLFEFSNQSLFFSNRCDDGRRDIKNGKYDIVKSGRSLINGMLK